MIELALEFLFAFFSVSGAKKRKTPMKPIFVAGLVVWLGLVFSLTLIFG